jgi:hypothetical protein
MVGQLHTPVICSAPRLLAAAVDRSWAVCFYSRLLWDDMVDNHSLPSILGADHKGSHLIRLTV